MTRKRFTDADKWEDEWFYSLSPFSKLVWLYVLDRCDHAGFWKVNKPIAEICLGTHIDWEVVEKDLRGRIEPQSEGAVWFLPKFLKFQYPKGLDDNCKPHKGVIGILRDRNCFQRVRKLFGNSYLRVQDKEQEQDKEQDSSSNATPAETGPTPAEHDGVCAPYPPGEKRIYPKERPARVGLVEWLVHHPRCIIGKDRDLWQGLFDYAGHETMSEAYGKMPSDAKLWFSVFNDFIHANYEEEKPNGTQG
jgi:hypothetical protein